MEKSRIQKIYLAILIIISILLISTITYADELISTIRYSIDEGYILRIKHETTVEEFLSSVSSNNNQTLKVFDGTREMGSTELVKTGAELKVGNVGSYILVVRGDINPDGRITPTDLSQLKQHRVGLVKLEGARLRAADINYNGEVTSLDVSQFKMLLVDLDMGKDEITTGNITVTQNTTDPVKEVTLNIEVKQDANLDYDKMKVSLDNGVTWQNCTGQVKVRENTEVLIKLVKEYTYESYNFSDTFDVENLTEEQIKKDDETEEEYMQRLAELGYAELVTTTEEVIVEEHSHVVNNVDSMAPDAFEFTATTTTNSIIVEAATIDKLKDYEGNIVQNTYSGVKTYEYRINDDPWQSSNEFINLTKNTEYRVYVRAIDYAGNITEATNSGAIIKTDNIEIPNASIKFEVSETDVTNEDVTVTMKSEGLEDTGFKIQYQVNGTDGVWQNGSKYLAKGNCTIYARVADDEGQEGTGEYASITITNIDKLAPNQFTPEIVEKTNNNVRIRATVDDREANETNCKSGIDTYTYYILNDRGEEITKTEEKVNEYNFMGLDLENHGYYIYVTAKDKAGNATVSEGIGVGKIEQKGLGIGVINPGPENVTVNDGVFRYFNPVIPVGFKAINTEDASWEGIMPKDWNKGLVIEDVNGNQFVWIPVDGEAVKYEKGTMVWDYGDNEEWERLTNQVAGDELPLSLIGLNEQEIGQIEKYEGFYVSRYEAGNNDNTLASQEGLRVVNAVTYEQAKNYAESMYRIPKVKSGLLTGTMWDTMTKWIANEKGEDYVVNNINSGNTYETAFTFSGMYAEGPNSVSEIRGQYKTGTNINKLAKTRALLTTGIVENFKDKNIYDTAGNVWEYTSEYLINDDNKKEFIARGGNYYWPYDRIVAAGTGLREYVSDIEGQARNEGGFRIALFLVDGAAEVGVFEDFNRTINGGAPSYDNPVIPAGFAAMNEGANWGNGITVEPEWNDGLIIEDINGNQFVWVPIDGTDVKYEKWTHVGVNSDETTGDDLPAKVLEWNETDKTQVEKYGGFYIARYESSVTEDGKVLTQEGLNVALDLSYERMKAIAENMEIKEENEEYVATGLVTGAQWDSVMRWMANEIGNNYILQDSTSWGTYGDTIRKTGATSLKNIYDMAGNAWEATAEKQGNTKRIYRGGVHLDTTVPVAYRGAKELYYRDAATGFRIALFITGDVKSEISVVPIQDDVPLNGTRGTPPIPDASKSVTFEPSTTEWTNKDIEVTIKNTNPHYITQYQIGTTSGKWNRGDKFTVKNNGTIYGRLANTKGQGGSTVKYVIGNIDKVAPAAFTPSTTYVGPFSITLNSNAVDTLSGIGNCAYYVNGMLVHSGPEATYKIKNLTEKTTYEIYVIATDRAGNSTKSTTITVTTPDKYIQNAAELGAYVKYDGSGYTDWRVLSKSGTSITIVSADSVASLGLHGEDGTWNGASYLQTIANFFVNDKYATSARSINTGDVGALSSIGAAQSSTTIWLPETYSNGYKNRDKGHYALLSNGTTGLQWLYHMNNSYRCDTAECGVRVIVTLKDNLLVAGGDGTKDDPWILEGDTDKSPKVGDYVQYTANNYSKWRVLANRGSYLQIVSAGNVENVTLSGSGGVSGGPSQINNAAQKYLNSTYATSARSIDIPDLAVLRKNGLSSTGSPYWLPRSYYHGYKGRTHGVYAVDSSGSSTARWNTIPDAGDTLGYIGKLYHYNDWYWSTSRSYGVRPVVTLKSQVKIIGGSGTESDPWIISTGSNTGIGVSYSDTKPTKENVKVTLKNNSGNSSTTLKYQINSTSGTWQNYTAPIEMTSNGTINVRLYNNNQVINTATAVVDNIDKVKPTINEVTPDVSENAIIITLRATDTGTAGISADNIGIEAYGISESSTVEPTYLTCSPTAELNVTISTIEKGGTYYVWVKDRAGNVTVEKLEVDSFGEIPSEIAQIGDFVNYSVNVGGKTYNKWRILDFDNNGHMEIVCYNGPRFTMFGEDDYSNAIKILNDASIPYGEGTYGYSTRHLGSDPSNPSSYATISTSYVKFYGGSTPSGTRAYLEQTHHESDLVAVQSFSGTNKLAGVRSWLASRHVMIYGSYSGFDVRVVRNSGPLSYDELSRANSRGQGESSSNSALAPVVILESGVKIDTSTTGNGSEGSPWTLTK